MRGGAGVLAAGIALVVLVGVAAASGAPLVSAGLDQDVRLGDTVYLDGGGTHVPDGELDRLSWSIETPDGDSITPNCIDCVQTSFVPNQTGEYSVTLTARSDSGVERSDSLYVTVGDMITQVNRSAPVNQSEGGGGDGGSDGCFISHEGDDGDAMSHGICDTVGSVVDIELGGNDNYIDSYILEGEGSVHGYSGAERIGGGEYRVPSDSIHHQSVNLYNNHQFVDASSNIHVRGIEDNSGSNRRGESNSDDKDHDPITGGYTLPPNYP